MPRYSTTERLGVNAVEQITLRELGWIFREQPVVDMGIDAQIELVDHGQPTGKLLAVQIKTGLSHFHETNGHYVYYGDLTHLDYWTGHSLPVIFVAYFLESDTTLWASVDEDSVERTSSGWKIAIPKSQVFGDRTSESLSVLFEGTPALQKLRTLSIHEPLMRHIANGGRVSVELEDWINKSLGRTPVRVFVQEENGDKTLELDWFQYYVGYGVKELAEALFPWAIAVVDEEFYEENADEDPDQELARATDADNDVYATSDPDCVYPYSEAAGEVEFYRLALKLNELGRAFLLLSDYMSASK